MKNENLENAVESTEIIVEEVSNKTETLKKIAGVSLVVGLGVGIYFYVKKRRNAKKEQIVVCEETVDEVVEDKKASKK